VKKTCSACARAFMPKRYRGGLQKYCSPGCSHAARRAKRPPISSARRCAHCRKSLRQRAGEQWTNFAIRKYCDTKCRGRAAVKYRERKRLCLHCGCLFERAIAELPCQFHRRNFCGDACRAARNREQGPPLKTGSKCARCGIALARRAGELKAHFNVRRFCDRRCANSTWSIGGIWFSPTEVAEASGLTKQSITARVAAGEGMLSAITRPKGTRGATMAAVGGGKP
jgi:hypothetical protein